MVIKSAYQVWNPSNTARREGQLYSRMARPYSTPREKVWDMAIEQLVAQELVMLIQSHHDGNHQSQTCDLLHPQFRFL